MFVKIEEPVVEYPEIVSKKALVILGIALGFLMLQDIYLALEDNEWDSHLS